MVVDIGPFLQDFTIIMIVASVMAMVSYKLKQPLVIGYIIAGMIIGPFTPPFSLIRNFDVLNLFAEIGVILLLFVVGMEFPIEKLRKIGKRAFVIASSEALGTFTIGYLVCQALNYSLSNSLFLALAISVTSTVIVMRILEELAMIKEEASVIILGVAVIEDIIIISAGHIAISFFKRSIVWNRTSYFNWYSFSIYRRRFIYRFKGSTKICKSYWENQPT
jgi:monovalent cation:H+ antiporter-2, CPA2 family